MVVYFTGTGNSKYIAQLISNKLNDNLVDANTLIKNKEYPQFNSEFPYVFVCPTYAWQLPRIFRDWIAKCAFLGNKKAYFILTCGSDIGNAEKYIKKFAFKIGLTYMGTTDIVMPENYIVMFESNEKSEDKDIFTKATDKTLNLCEQKIAYSKPFEEVNPSFVDHLKSGIVNSSFYTFYIGARKFFATDDCISCGQCVTNCPLNNIALKEGKPIWGKNCTHCMACICKCPTEAIEYGKNTKGKRRYQFKKQD